MSYVIRIHKPEFFYYDYYVTDDHLIGADADLYDSIQDAQVHLNELINTLKTINPIFSRDDFIIEQWEGNN